MCIAFSLEFSLKAEMTNFQQRHHEPIHSINEKCVLSLRLLLSLATLGSLESSLANGVIGKF